MLDEKISFGVGVKGNAYHSIFNAWCPKGILVAMAHIYW